MDKRTAGRRAAEELASAARTLAAEAHRSPSPGMGVADRSRMSAAFERLAAELEARAGRGARSVDPDPDQMTIHDLLGEG